MNLEFLQEVEDQPHIDIEEANPRLYDHVVEIQEIKVRDEVLRWQYSFYSIP